MIAFACVQSYVDIFLLKADATDAISRQIIRIEANRRFPLSEAAAAHRALEGRETTGSIVLIPDSEETR